MPTDRKPSLILPVAVTLAVVLGLYMGAYYWLVTPYTGWRGGFLTREEVLKDAVVVAVYSHGGDFSRRIFAPMNWVDRRLRPDFWQPDFEEVKRRYGRLW